MPGLERICKPPGFRSNLNKALSYAMAEEALGGKMPDGFTEDMKQKLAGLK